MQIDFLDDGFPEFVEQFGVIPVVRSLIGILIGSN